MCSKYPALEFNQALFMVPNIIFAIILGIMFNSCNRPASNIPELIAFYNNEAASLFVKEEKLEEVTNILNVKEEKGRYMMPNSSAPFEIKIIITDEIHYYVEDYLMSFDPLEQGPMENSSRKIYGNAQCGVSHSGFVAECIATFGDHKTFGDYMQWHVNPWNTCTAGSDICIEYISIIGSIHYFDNTECINTDSMYYDTQPLFKMKC